MTYDGCQLLASGGGGREPELWTRNLNIVTASYPEVAEALSTTFGAGGRIVLDGGIVAMDRGRPSGLLQRRLCVAHATKPLQRRIPVTYLPFDALVRNGVELLRAPYLDRRAELAELGSIIGKIGGLPITVPPHWESQTGRVMLNAARSAQMEGIVAKRSNSLYLPGQRNRSWIKTAIRTRGTVLAIGFVGSSRSVAALVLGASTADGRLKQVGHVSSGLSGLGLHAPRIIIGAAAVQWSTHPYLPCPSSSCPAAVTASGGRRQPARCPTRRLPGSHTFQPDHWTALSHPAGRLGCRPAPAATMRPGQPPAPPRKDRRESALITCTPGHTATRSRSW
nr:hypothetical protein [Rhodococcus sp. T7]